ncbi:hypothetical protein PTSG_08330 [Salpingoeca rosetta]|uniref:Uncharacterized protein n=1 Tax=Salpingoeca rosetta (strain ATCC 50818 / BSB-021) TaxID=946362 RepID=F2UJD9_SALR5|nr:uncharacterized protein PTSG_08330 [Salpingoeca rosetta]EGD77238.1 hypothetical protein PTSG_08330 [Salpingoeca rosetta]|eukprot:XP_004990582.1 hypothetical protein PTSG_08330 [Salpingoeca rosetta]
MVLETHHHHHQQDVDVEEWLGSAAIARVAALPYISRAVAAAAPYVPSKKDSQLVGRFERICSSHAKPFLERHADKLKQLDEYACQKLDAMETAATSLRQRFTTVRDEVNSKAVSVERVLLAPTQMILDRADAFLEAMQTDVDFDNEQDNDNDEDDAETPATTAATGTTTTTSTLPTKPSTRLGSETREIAHRTRDLSHRVQLLAYARALRQLRNAQRRGVALIHTVEPYSKPIVEYSEKQFDKWITLFAHHHDDDDDDDNAEFQDVETVSLTQAIRRPVERTVRAARRASIANIHRLRDAIAALDASAKSTAASARQYPAVLTSKAGDLVCSAKQTRVYSQLMTQLDAIKRNRRVVTLSEKLVSYLELLGITIPQRVLRLMPGSHSRRREEQVQVNLTYAQVARAGDGDDDDDDSGDDDHHHHHHHHHHQHHQHHQHHHHHHHHGDTDDSDTSGDDDGDEKDEDDGGKDEPNEEDDN